MLTKFWEETAKGIAGEWAARALTPALLFWGVGFYFWARQFTDWQKIQDNLTMTDVQGLTWIVAALFVLVASIGLMNWLTLPALKFMEGYWPGPLSGLRRRRARKKIKIISAKKTEIDTLSGKESLTAKESERLAWLDHETLMRYPNDPALVMPTRLGNILRAAEEYPLRYGFEINSTLPRLWLVLPENVKKELNGARQVLDERIRLALWGALLVIWCFFAPGWIEAALVLAAAVAVVAVSYLFSLSAAEVYGDLLRSAYDLHRFDLYKQLGWPLPSTPAEEKATGTALHNHLYRFSKPAKVRFTHSEEDPGEA